jgi:VWFA-related protein
VNALRRPLLSFGGLVMMAAALAAHPVDGGRGVRRGAERQQPPAPSPQAQQPPVFKAGTNQVRVDVTVLDRKGEPVTGLTKADFEVLEDGMPQSIETLKLVEATGAAPADDTSLPIRSPEHAAAEAARDDIRVFVIFWDEYHIGQMAPAIRARQALSGFVQTAFGPTDLVAVMDQLTPTDAIRFTRDRQELAEQVRRLQGRQGVYVPPRSAIEESQMYGGRDIEMTRSQVTASALESTIAFLGPLKEGRKSILFVSQSIGHLGSTMQDNFEWLNGAIRTANVNNTTIYTLDPRGLSMSSMSAMGSGILEALAVQTGGKHFASNFPAASLREVVKNASAFYLLGYISASNPADGKFHKISVRVKRSGVEVKSRTGYYAPSLAEMETARTRAAAAEAPPEISKALEKLVDAPHITVTRDVWAGATVGPTGTPRITVAWSARTAKADGSVSIRATGSDGRVYFDGPMPSERAAFDAPPGVLHLREQVMAAEGTVSDRQEFTLDVPDFQARPLSISTPAIFRARTPLELRALRANADPDPFAGHQFDRTDRVLVRFGVFGSAAADATVSAHLLSSHGAALTALPLKAAAAGYEMELPVGSIARGEYVMAIEASHGAAQAKTLLSFRIN